MATKRNAEEIQRLLEEYRQSGEKRTAFCRRQGIPVTTLDYYLRRQALQARPRLARVKLTAKSSDPTATFASCCAMVAAAACAPKCLCFGSLRQARVERARYEASTKQTTEPETELPGTEICRTLDEETGNTMRQTARASRSQARRVPPAKTYRFDARLNEDQKLLIQRAADLEGRTMTDFVLHSAEAAAERTIENRAMLVLTARETEAFVDAILNPAGPGPVLRRAAREYREKIAKR